MKGLRMTRSVLAALVVGSAAIVAAPVMAHAQNFKVEKFDIKGDGGTDHVAVEPATGGLVQFDRYVGRYQLAPIATLTITRQDTRSSRPTDWSARSRDLCVGRETTCRDSAT